MAKLDLSVEFDSKSYASDTPATAIEFIAKNGIRFHAVGSKKGRWVFYKPGTPALVNAGHLQKDGSITILNPDPSAEIGFVTIKYSDDLELRDNKFFPYFGPDGAGSSARVSVSVIPSADDFKPNEISQAFDLKIREIMPDAAYLKESTSDWLKTEGLLNSHMGLMVEAFGIARPAACGLTIAEIKNVRNGAMCDSAEALVTLYETELLSADQRVRDGFKQVLEQLFERIMPAPKRIFPTLAKVGSEHRI